MNLELEEKDVQRRESWCKTLSEEIPPKAAIAEETGYIPDDFFKSSKLAAILQPFLPSELGGENLNLFQLALLLEETGRHSPAMAMLFAYQVILGIRLNKQSFDFAEKSNLAKSAAALKSIFTIAATEREAGCDLSSLSTTCKKLSDGKIGLSGYKAYVNWAGRADYILVLANASDFEGGGTALIAVPAKSSGVTIGSAHKTLGMSGIEAAPVEFNDVVVPPEHVVGVYGFGTDLYERLMGELRIAVSATATGLAQQVYDEAAAHAKSRKQFGKPIGSFQSLQWRFAESALKLEASRLHVWRAVEQSNSKTSTFVQTSIAKVFCSESAFEVADFAMQVMGSLGYLRPNNIERLFRDARFLKIGYGTSEILRNYIGARL